MLHAAFVFLGLFSSVLCADVSMAEIKVGAAHAFFDKVKPPYSSAVNIFTPDIDHNDVRAVWEYLARKEAKQISCKKSSFKDRKQDNSRKQKKILQPLRKRLNNIFFKPSLGARTCLLPVGFFDSGHIKNVRLTNLEDAKAKNNLEANKGIKGASLFVQADFFAGNFVPVIVKRRKGAVLRKAREDMGGVACRALFQALPITHPPVVLRVATPWKQKPDFVPSLRKPEPLRAVEEWSRAAHSCEEDFLDGFDDENSFVSSFAEPDEHLSDFYSDDLEEESLLSEDSEEESSAMEVVKYLQGFLEDTFLYIFEFCSPEELKNELTERLVEKLESCELSDELIGRFVNIFDEHFNLAGQCAEEEDLLEGLGLLQLKAVGSEILSLLSSEWDPEWPENAQSVFDETFSDDEESEDGFEEKEGLLLSENAEEEPFTLAQAKYLTGLLVAQFSKYLGEVSHDNLKNYLRDYLVWALEHYDGKDDFVRVFDNIFDLEDQRIEDKDLLGRMQLALIGRVFLDLLDDTPCETEGSVASEDNESSYYSCVSHLSERSVSNISIAEASYDLSGEKLNDAFVQDAQEDLRLHGGSFLGDEEGEKGQEEEVVMLNSDQSVSCLKEVTLLERCELLRNATKAERNWRIVEDPKTVSELLANASAVLAEEESGDEDSDDSSICSHEYMECEGNLVLVSEGVEGAEKGYLPLTHLFQESSEKSPAFLSGLCLNFDPEVDTPDGPVDRIWMRNFDEAIYEKPSRDSHIYSIEKELFFEDQVQQHIYEILTLVYSMMIEEKGDQVCIYGVQHREDESDGRRTILASDPSFLRLMVEVPANKLGKKFVYMQGERGLSDDEGMWTILLLEEASDIKQGSQTRIEDNNTPQSFEVASPGFFVKADDEDYSDMTHLTGIQRR